jgi:hypothetical protein
LPTQQTDDHGFEIGALKIGFPEDAAVAAEIIDDEIHVVVIAVW